MFASLTQLSPTIRTCSLLLYSSRLQESAHMCEVEEQGAFQEDCSLTVVTKLTTNEPLLVHAYNMGILP